ALYRQIAKRFPNRGVAAVAKWLLGWIAWLNGDLRTAAAEWRSVADVSSRRDLRLPALYWRGRALEMLRDEAGAVALYARVLGASGDPALPRAFWEVIYPLGWRDEVAETAGRVGLDPFLIAAIVREESSYYPRAVSRAGARGLMQLMPATAKPMADVRGLPFEGGGLLDDPRANLDLGTAFFAGLMKEFGDPRLAIAAYNAGP